MTDVLEAEGITYKPYRPPGDILKIGHLGDKIGPRS